MLLWKSIMKYGKISSTQIFTTGKQRKLLRYLHFFFQLARVFRSISDKIWESNVEDTELTLQIH